MVVAAQVTVPAASPSAGAVPQSRAVHLTWGLWQVLVKTGL